MHFKFNNATHLECAHAYVCVARRALSAYTDSTIEGTRAVAEVFLRYVILLLLSLAWFPTLGNITVTP